jgi:hypothetical protein
MTAGNGLVLGLCKGFLGFLRQTVEVHDSFLGMQWNFAALLMLGKHGNGECQEGEGELSGTGGGLEGGFQEREGGYHEGG